MKASKTTVYRGLGGMLAGGLLGAAASATIALPTAGAAPENCSASDVASTVSSVQQSVSGYLESNTEVNDALSDIAKQPAAQAQASYQTYFAENPDVADELRSIQQPVRALNDECGIEVTPSQSIEALEAI